MSLRARVRSALWMIPLAVLAIITLPTPWMGAFMAAVLLAGLYEWAGLARMPAGPGKLAYVLANAALLAWLAWTDDADHSRLKPLVLVGGLFCLACLAWLWRFGFGREDNARNCGIKLLAGTLACVPAWAALVLVHGGDRGPAWTLFAIALIAAADSGAYLFGVNFGKRKLAPNISPGKSWEGFWGGLGTTVAIAALGTFLFGAPLTDLWRFAVLGLFTALFSVTGDLFESLLKRQAQVKDSSNLIPGHGGLLDRLDSIVSGLTVFALMKFWLGL